MNRKLRYISCGLFVIVVFEALTIFNLREMLNDAHLSYCAFQVIDHDSRQPVPDFKFEFPETSSSKTYPRNSTFLRGKDFNIFMTVATQPVTVRILKDGYEDASIEVDPSHDGTTVSFFTGVVQTVILKKVK